MRMFLAIELEEAWKEQLSLLQQEVGKRCQGGHFTEKNNLHLTVKFIGEVKRDELGALVAATAEAGGATRAFSMEIARLGYFSRGKRAILWAGIGANPALVRLHQNVERAMQKQGFARDRAKYTPHITLGRELAFLAPFEQMQKEAAIDIAPMAVTRLSLMESRREGPRLIYRPVFVQNLRGK